MERPFQTINPRPYSAPSTVVWNGNFNSGEEEETWPQGEPGTLSNTNVLTSSSNDNKNKR